MTRDSINKMSLRERIRTMEMLWDSLIKDEKDLESPGWHKDILDARRKKMQSGKVNYVSIDDLKKLKW